MNRSLAIALTVTLAGALTLLSSLPFPAREVVAQQFPASAVIRGENIRLRGEPAMETDVIAVLQRGDQITITGDATTADGDQFYPVEVVATGDTGWVRVLFVNPKSIVPVAEPAPAAEEPAPAAEEPAEEPNNQRQNRQQRQQERQERRNQAAAEETPAPEEAAPPAATPAPEPQETPPAAETLETPAAEPAPEETAITFSGEGAATSEAVTLEAGRYRATATVEISEPSGLLCNLSGPRNFSETLFDEQIDEPQSLTIRASINLEDAGDYVVECSDTNDPWTITLEPRGG